MIQLDTHVVIWLYQGDIGRLSKKAIEQIEQYPIGISPMVYLEMEYLYEIGRIKTDAGEIVKELKNTINLQLIKTSFINLIENSLTQKWTRDTFDRIITSTAAYDDSILITKDKNILENYKYAVWD